MRRSAVEARRWAIVRSGQALMGARRASQRGERAATVLGVPRIAHARRWGVRAGEAR